MNSAKRVYIGVGSNINAKENIDKALGLLNDSVGSIKSSPVYKNPALGFSGDDFLNLVITFEYAHEISDLLKVIEEIEKCCGRQRELETGKGSRTIDLDLLIFGDLEGRHHGLELPRSDVFNYQFVWQPLLDLFALSDQLSVFENRVRSEIECVRGCQKLYPMTSV